MLCCKPSTVTSHEIRKPRVRSFFFPPGNKRKNKDLTLFLRFFCEHDATLRNSTTDDDFFNNESDDK
jgi:hypothetical protein